MSDAPIDELKAIAHPVRFSILQSLAAGERNVGEIEAVTGIGQPSLSQQLAVLRNAGLVQTRKEAKLVYYQLDHGRLESLSDAIDQAQQGYTPGAAWCCPLLEQPRSGCKHDSLLANTQNACALVSESLVWGRASTAFFEPDFRRPSRLSMV